MKLLSLVVLLLSIQVQAYTIGFYTDEKSLKFTKKTIAEFEETYPFNQFDIQYEIIYLDKLRTP